MFVRVPKYRCMIKYCYFAPVVYCIELGWPFLLLFFFKKSFQIFDSMCVCARFEVVWHEFRILNEVGKGVVCVCVYVCTYGYEFLYYFLHKSKNVVWINDK